LHSSQLSVEEVCLWIEVNKTAKTLLVRITIT
jgi:hypothetical protein